jgi:microcystin-dependent protein
MPLKNGRQSSDLQTVLLGSVIPPGTVAPFAGGVVPDGWLLCNGAAVSRSVYSELFSKIGVAHGSGDGSTTFRLPDYRGRFLRGRDGGVGNDPDRSSRTASNTGGNTGDNVGSVQGRATARPNNSFTTDTLGSHTHTMPNQGSLSSNSTGGGSGTFNGAGTTYETSAAGNHAHTITGGGDNETRPINSYVNYIIKI